MTEFRPSLFRRAFGSLGKAVLGQSIETFYVRVRQFATLDRASSFPPAAIGPEEFIARVFAYMDAEKRCIAETTGDIAAWLALPQRIRETVRRALSPVRFDPAPCPCRGLSLHTLDWTVCTLCGHAWTADTTDRVVISDVREILTLNHAALTHVDTDGEPTGECVYCHEQMLRKFLTRDHVWPKRLRGPGGHSPIVLACVRCNNKRGEMTVVSFTEWLASPKGQNWLASRPRTPKAPWR